MKYNPEIHHRKSSRLKGYDYSQDGAYFVTICCKDRECLFGKIKNGKMILNNAGKIIRNELRKTSEIRKNMKIDYFVVMPNHMHAIVIINNSVGAYCNTPLRNTPLRNTPLRNTPLRIKFQSPSNNLGAMVRGYKSATTKQINKLGNTPKNPGWQRNYHEHIIRNEESFEKIHDYIIYNPQNWKNDKFFVQ